MANKKIRLLLDQSIDGIAYKCNDVIDLPAESAKPLIEQGSADDSKSAVAYCVTELGRQVIAHSALAVDAEITPETPAETPPAEQGALE